MWGTAARTSTRTGTTSAGWPAAGFDDQDSEQSANLAVCQRDPGGRGSVALQVHFSWAPDDNTALAIAHDQWRHGVITAPELWDIEQPEEFDRRSDTATRLAMSSSSSATSTSGFLSGPAMRPQAIAGASGSRTILAA